MNILKKEHQPGVYVPLRALFLVFQLPVFVLLNIGIIHVFHTVTFAGSRGSC